MQRRRKYRDPALMSDRVLSDAIRAECYEAMEILNKSPRDYLIRTNLEEIVRLESERRDRGLQGRFTGA
jgi:hypothetical protein